MSADPNIAGKVRNLRIAAEPPRAGGIDADMVAFKVMDHIDTMYPEIWENVPKIARVSIRNTIVRSVMTEDAKR